MDAGDCITVALWQVPAYSSSPLWICTLPQAFVWQLSFTICGFSIYVHSLLVTAQFLAKQKRRSFMGHIESSKASHFRSYEKKRHLKSTAKCKLDITHSHKGTLGRNKGALLKCAISGCVNILDTQSKLIKNKTATEMEEVG